LFENIFQLNKLTGCLEMFRWSLKIATLCSSMVCSKILYSQIHHAENISRFLQSEVTDKLG